MKKTFSPESAASNHNLTVGDSHRLSGDLEWGQWAPLFETWHLPSGQVGTAPAPGTNPGENDQGSLCLFTVRILSRSWGLSYSEGFSVRFSAQFPASRTELKIAL